METVTKKLYEAMFLVDSAQAAADWEGSIAAIETVFKRADAEVVSLKKWDERKLAYDIDHKSRGTYLLAYFKVDGTKIAGIEKDVLLSEKIIRVLVLTTEGRPEDMIDNDIQGVTSPVAAAKAAAEEADAEAQDQDDDEDVDDEQ